MRNNALQPFYAVALALGVFLAGCNSGQSVSAPAPTNDRWSVAPWSAPPHQGQKTVAEGPAAEVFVEFVATPQDVVNKMLKMANVRKDDVVCDLGCGDGRIVVTAARRYGCQGIGYDLDPLRVQEARKNAERHGVGHLVTIEEKDVLTVDLHGVSVVMLYMGTELNARLIPQLRTLPAGARIVSHNFGLADIPPDETVEMTSREDHEKHSIYLWRCPLREPGVR